MKKCRWQTDLDDGPVRLVRSAVRRGAAAAGCAVHGRHAHHEHAVRRRQLHRPGDEPPTTLYDVPDGVRHRRPHVHRRRHANRVRPQHGAHRHHLQHHRRSGPGAGGAGVVPGVQLVLPGAARAGHGPVPGVCGAGLHRRAARGAGAAPQLRLPRRHARAGRHRAALGGGRRAVPAGALAPAQAAGAAAPQRQRTPRQRRADARAEDAAGHGGGAAAVDARGARRGGRPRLRTSSAQRARPGVAGCDVARAHAGRGLRGARRGEPARQPGHVVHAGLARPPAAHASRRGGLRHCPQPCGHPQRRRRAGAAPRVGRAAAAALRVADQLRERRRRLRQRPHRRRRRLQRPADRPDHAATLPPQAVEADDSALPAAAIAAERHTGRRKRGHARVDAGHDPAGGAALQEVAAQGGRGAGAGPAARPHLREHRAGAGRLLPERRQLLHADALLPEHGGAGGRRHRHVPVGRGGHRRGGQARAAVAGGALQALRAQHVHAGLHHVGRRPVSFRVCDGVHVARHHVGRRGLLQGRHGRQPVPHRRGVLQPRAVPCRLRAVHGYQRPHHRHTWATRRHPKRWQWQLSAVHSCIVNCNAVLRSELDLRTCCQMASKEKTMVFAPLVLKTADNDL
ncbi:uncharacterized protein LOC126354562 isoform X2 [Schistocerca gregaria]|uniref:uncharacterized protein LOC126354562 isoform X2 n=1 Tax=Schistocerca gregaria TaxID=7010 RepID=UPI00211E56D1|nr:uncharacterized protein LOC126354562 isoform X2 [Schistocerca gregaria]